MDKNIHIKVENSILHKVIMSVICFGALILFLCFYFTAMVVNYINIVLYVVGPLFVFWCWLKMILPFLYTNGNNVKYQSLIVPFYYKKIKLQDIKKVKIITKLTNSDSDNLMGGEPYDMMICYGEKRRLFSVSMSSKNAKQFLNLLRATYGVQIREDRKS